MTSPSPPVLARGASSALAMPILIEVTASSIFAPRPHGPDLSRRGPRVQSAHVPTVVFVAPFFLETTLRFVRAVAELPDVRLGVISQEPAERLPDDLRAPAGRPSPRGRRPRPGAARGAGARALAGELGPPERLLGVLEQLQVPLAEAREALAAAGMPVPGLSLEAARNFRDKSRHEDGAGRRRPALRRATAWPRTPAAARRVRGGGRLPAGRQAAGRRRRREHLPARRRRATWSRRWRCISPSAERPLLLEEFVTGREHSFDSVVSTAVRSGTRSPTTSRRRWRWWARRGSSGASLLPREVDDPRYDAIRDVGFRARWRRSGMDTGLSHMEWFRLADGRVAISEVGARPPGAQITTLMSCAHDVDLYRAWARLMVFDHFDPPAPPLRRRRRLPARPGERQPHRRGPRARRGAARAGRAGRGSEAPHARPAAVGQLRGRGLRHRAPPRDRGRGAGAPAAGLAGAGRAGVAGKSSRGGPRPLQVCGLAVLS